MCSVVLYRLRGGSHLICQGYFDPPNFWANHPYLLRKRPYSSSQFVLPISPFSSAHFVEPLRAFGLSFLSGILVCGNIPCSRVLCRISPLLFRSGFSGLRRRGNSPPPRARPRFRWTPRRRPPPSIASELGALDDSGFSVRSSTRGGENAPADRGSWPQTP